VVTSTIDRGGVWTSASASVRGAAHVRSGLVNQDAVLVVTHDLGHPLTAAAVADGHGGARYVRSQVGSQLAVEIACAEAARVGRALGPTPSPRAIRAQLLEGLIDPVIERWRAAVLEHAAQHPFTDEESVTAGSPLEDADPLISYGCTLLVALLGPTWAGFAQVGDGDVVLIGRDGSVEAPVPGDDRLVGGETTSLCLPSARVDARVAVCVPAPEIVLLATDGYGNSFASPAWMQEAGTGFAEILRTKGWDRVVDQLPEWLAESAEAGGDDVTVALSARDADAGPPPGAVASGATAAPSSAPPGPPATGPASRRRGATLGLLLLVAVLVGAGVAVGYLLGRDDPADVATTTASTSTTTSTSTAPAETVAPVPTEQPPAGQDPAQSAAIGGSASIVAPPGPVPGVQVIEFDPVPGSTAPPMRVARIADGTIQPVTTLIAGDALWEIQEGTGRLRRQGAPDDGARNVALDGVPAGGLAVAGDRVWVANADGSAIASVDFDGTLDGGWRPVMDAADSLWLLGGDLGNQGG
jgi:hypothetical protein